MPDLVRKYSFIDSIAFRMPKLLDKTEFRELRAALVGERRRRSRGRTFFVVEKVYQPPPNRHLFHLIFWIHQPTRAAIRLMQGDGRGKLYAVHIALDALPADRWGPIEVQGFLVKRIRTTSSPEVLTRWDRDTIYIGEQELHYTAEDGSETRKRSRRGRKIVIYSDRESKVSGAPCTHIEYRVTGSQFLDREGLTLEELLDLDHSAFWSKRLRLYAPFSETRLYGLMAERLGRWQRVNGQGEVMPRRERIAHAEEMVAERLAHLGLSARDLAGQDWLFVCQELELLRGKRIGMLFRDDDPSLLIPGSGNALWEYED